MQWRSAFPGAGTGAATDICRNVRTRRAYSLATSKKALYLVSATLCIAGGGFFLKDAVAHPLGRPLSVPFGILFIIPGLMLGSSSLRSRLVLDGDQLELRSALRTRTVRRDDIDGLQRIRYDYGTSTRLFLKEHRGDLTVSGAFTGSGDLNDWLKGLPDIDERNAAQIEKMIDGQEKTGVASRSHEQLLRKAKRWVTGLNMVAGAACLAAAVPYRPIYFPGIAASLVFPPIAVVLLHRFPLLFSTFKAKVDPRADVTSLILFPGFGVLLSEVFESNPSHLVDPASLLLWGALTFIAFLGSLAGMMWKSPARWAALFWSVFCGLMYSVGLVDTVDTMPDHSTPSLFRTWIVKMHEQRHSRFTSFELRVAPWGPVQYADDIDVTAGTYRRSKVGDPVCLSLHRGFLHAPWYELVPCAGLSGRDVALSVPETARDASALLTDAQRDAARRPRDAHAQFVLGMCLVQLERYDEALPQLLAAERLDSTDPWSRNAIGWVLNQQGRFLEAVPHLQAAVALDSTYTSAQQNLAWAYVNLNDLPDAERTDSLVVRLESKSGEAALQYAWVLERLYGARAAEGQTARALLLEPKNGRIQAFAGALARREARFADARQHYEVATRLLPNDAAVWAELAATDYLMNDRAAAAAAFATSVRIDGNYVRSRPELMQMWQDAAPGNAR